jgi:hypothetical protein
MSSAGAASLAALVPARAAASRRNGARAGWGAPGSQSGGWCAGRSGAGPQPLSPWRQVARPKDARGQGALGAQARNRGDQGGKKTTNEPNHVQEKQWVRDLTGRSSGIGMPDARRLASVKGLRGVAFGLCRVG